MKKLLALFDEHHYGSMLAVLVILFILYPYLELCPFGELTLDSLLTLLLVLLCLRIKRVGLRARIQIGICITILPLVWVDSYLNQILVEIVEHLFLCFLLLSAAISVVIDLFKSHRVSFNHLAGCGTAYFLLGFVFASIYYVLNAYFPGSIHTPTESTLHFSEALSLSLNTMTTLGYSLYAPNSHMARSLVVLEAVSGQLFLTVLVGQVVGMYTSHRMLLGKDASV